MLIDCTAGKGNLSVTGIGHLAFRHARTASAASPRNLAHENIGPLLHGFDGSRTLKNNFSQESLYAERLRSATPGGRASRLY